MVNRVRDGICTAIHKTFGEDYEIHTESVEQGFNGPCFFVSCTENTNRHLEGRRYERAHTFVIKYYPASEKKNQECGQVSELLFDALEDICIDTDTCVKGTEMSSVVAEDILNFTVHYDFAVMKQNDVEPEPMRKLKTNINVKER